MTTPSDLYVQGIYDRFLYFATWLPNMPISLGDVGVKNGKYFQRITSLKELNLSFLVRRGTRPLDFNHTSQSSVTIQARASTEASIDASPSRPVQAGVTVEFSQEGAFLFQAVRCLTSEIENKEALGQLVIEEYQQGKWDPNWTVIDTVVKAASATILVSNSRNAHIELSAKTTLSITNLADPNLGLTIHSQRGDITQLLAQQGLTPLFKLSRLKKPLLTLFTKGKITFGGKQQPKIQDLPEQEELWEELSLDD